MTDAVRSFDWFYRLAEPPESARRRGVTVALGSGVGLVVSGSIGIGALLRRQPLAGVEFLIPPAVIMLIVGQVWMLAVIGTRGQITVGGRFRRFSSPRRILLGDLAPTLGRMILGVAVLGWVLAIVGYFLIARNDHSDVQAGCPYVVNNHGLVCVSHDRYRAHQAAEQEFAGGLLMMFFAVHFGAALGGPGLARERPPVE